MKKKDILTKELEQLILAGESLFSPKMVKKALELEKAIA